MKRVLAIILGGGAGTCLQPLTLTRAKPAVPLGIGAGSQVANAILDKNVRIGRNVQVINKDHVQEGDRSALGFTIRDGIVVIDKNTTLADGIVI